MVAPRDVLFFKTKTSSFENEPEKPRYGQIVGSICGGMARFHHVGRFITSGCGLIGPRPKATRSFRAPHPNRAFRRLWALLMAASRAFSRALWARSAAFYTFWSSVSLRVKAFARMFLNVYTPPFWLTVPGSALTGGPRSGVLY